MLEVVAAAVVGPAGLLLVSKRAAPDVFYLPGGKAEPGEAAEHTLRRELREELGVSVRKARPFLDVRTLAALEPSVEMRMRVFLTELDGDPAPVSEIAEMLWWPHSRDLILAPAVRDCVLPALGLIQACSQA